MKRFARLFSEIESTTRTNEKVALLEAYFREVPSADAAWALQFLCGRTLPRVIPNKKLWQWMTEESGVPGWLADECYDAVGDMAETMALLLPDVRQSSTLSLAQVVEERLIPLRALPERASRELLLLTWRELNGDERLVWNKLITGNFRIGVARTLVIRALAGVAGVDPAVMAHRVMGKWNPTGADYLHLIGPADSHTPEIAQPYPFFLASPIEIKLKHGESLSALGNIDDWMAEWKWDGIRAQLIRRGGEALVWSRGDEMVTDSFPEIVEAGQLLPEGTVLDGEILAWRNDQPLPFAKLQRRLGRKQVGHKTRTEFPIVFQAYDLLELGGADLRSQPLELRRKQLEEVIAQASASARQPVSKPLSQRMETPMFPGLDILQDESRATVFPLRLSPLVHAGSWEELSQVQKEARLRGVEGLMLKNRSSRYGVGRERGDWWKWKIDPFLIDAVLIAAQPGSGRRASLFTDYTFGVWDNGQLVPVAKAYSGLTDDEILEVDAFVRNNTTGKFGPVRSVKPVQVFELAFEGIQQSTRHKSGIAVRFPRMNRWRKDKKVEEADTLETLRRLAKFDVM